MADHNSKTPLEFRNSYGTPYYLANWLDSLYDFDVDLAASDENALCDNYFTLEQDSLKQDWSKFRRGFLNPPYDKISPWVDKAIEEKKKGFITVMLIPTANGEDHYEKIFDNASDLIYINGRISFIAACDWIIPGKGGKPDRYIKKGEPVSGNTRGSFVVTFEPEERPLGLFYVRRDSIKKKFSINSGK